MMKTLALILFLFSATSEARTPVLRVGDVLLQPLKCWACSLIEAEEETIYSHVGVVLSPEPNLLIGEAFGKVRSISFDEFNKKTEPGQKIMVLRFRNDRLSQEFQTRSQKLMGIYESDFHGAKYDHDFRWNNFDEAGAEKFYCSEFISKLFQAFIRLETPIKRMHFEKNREQWMTYFKGNIPDNEWGNSPGDFERSEIFYKLGEL
jgi:hypothetical protein